MKSLSRILTVCLCCVPVFGAHAVPATTAGSNLTAYNPSNSYNNQWATVSNARYDGNTTAKVDFGNCNAVVLRCAQPKCNNGGCVDPSVASAIVSGCVKANSKCKQYGDDLIEYMTAQLVASSNAKINEQQMALEQARLQAEANAAAASAQNEQISQMQNQMYQMQQQMAQQQAESAQALQEALAQQAAQSQAAIDNMKVAATEAAKQTEAGITAYQQDAINRGISEEVLARQQITGQIQTEIEDAETSLVAMKKAMQNAFDYAECDARGNNCSAPKRIKKWRELAIGFLTPYDNAIDKIYDALVTAQTVGVDLSDIYMMLNNSCNSWGQYMCQKGAEIDYSGSTPMSCPKNNAENIESCERKCDKTTETSVVGGKFVSKTTYNKECQENCRKQTGCKPCTLLKVLSDKEEVYEGWVNADATDTENSTVVACASNALDNTKLFTRRTKNKNGAGLVDIDLLDRWLNQTEPNKVKNDAHVPAPQDYCTAEPNEAAENALSSAILSRVVNTEKTIPGNNLGFCVNWNGNKLERADTDDCPYINPIFAICDTHPFNSGNGVNFLRDESNTNTTDKTDAQADMNRIIGLKVTVVSQQMYKQYEYLNATLRRLKTQLQKAVLTSNLEAAGAKSESGSSSGGLIGGKSDSDKEIVLAGAENCWNSSTPKNAYACIQTNLNVIKSNISTNRTNAAKQLTKTVSVAEQWEVDVCADKNEKGACVGTDNCKEYRSNKYSSNKDDITKCANALSIAVAKKVADEDKSSNRYSGWGNQLR